MTLLVKYDELHQQLAAASTAKAVLSLRQDAQHIKLHGQLVRDRAIIADALAFQLHCERTLGQMLTAAKEAGELNARGRRKAEEGAAAPATLAEIGIDKKLSSKSQRAAALTDDDFKSVIDSVHVNVRAGGSIMVDPITAAAKANDIAQRRSAHAARAVQGGTTQDLAALARSGFKAQTLYIDPPWHYETYSAAGDGRSANTHYTTGLIDRIMQDLAPLKEIAAENAVLLPWVVDWGLHLALELITALGFEFKTVFATWAKLNASGEGWHMGQGHWTRANPEMCLLATIGKPKRLHADVQQLIVAPVMEHSRKPDEAYDRIERLVEGPYLECYARRPRKGWVSWGNELEFTGVAA